MDGDDNRSVNDVGNSAGTDLSNSTGNDAAVVGDPAADSGNGDDDAKDADDEEQDSGDGDRGDLDGGDNGAEYEVCNDGRAGFGADAMDEMVLCLLSG